MIQNSSGEVPGARTLLDGQLPVERVAAMCPVMVGVGESDRC